MKRHLIPIVTPESLLKMPTKQLLGRLRALQRCEESAALSDLGVEEIAANSGILFKDSTEWRDAYGHLKTVLAQREHIPTAAERTRTRTERGQLKPNRTSNHVQTARRPGSQRATGTI